MTEHLTQTQRDDFVHNTQAHAHDVLQIPQVAVRLGSFANELARLNHAIVPVVVNERVVYPGESSFFRVPATTLRIGETAARALSDGSHQSLQTPAEELAYVTTVERQLADGSVSRQSPLLVLNRDKANGRDYIAAPVSLHELQHVGQAIAAPLWPAEQPQRLAMDLRHELEGYHVSAMTILGIQQAGMASEYLAAMPQASIDNALEIEEIRERTNRYELDPFTPLTGVAEELVKNGHGITQFLQHKIIAR